MTNIVNFPGLGLYFEINRVAFTIGIREIYWYGIIIGLGLLLGVAFSIYEAKRVGLSSDNVLDVALIATPISIICARAYFVIFNFHQYKDNLLDIFNIRGGGIAIYGAIIGGVATAYIYCQRKNIDYRKFFDVGAFGLLIGQIIGRWGNFVNVEAYGSETNLPWRMEIFSDELSKMVSVHPTFLYESIWNLIGFIGLLIYRNKKKFEGEIVLLYIAWYGIGRSWIEQLRVDSLPYDASFKISQIVGIVTAAFAIYLIYKGRKKSSQTKEEIAIEDKDI
ncbi:MAG: prolipoprotein diacylglyceryl transferase [Eubacteriales bacterium]|jgi:phosphatidylglycerol:prolipoprotein diacylglycerol transferase|nr:prolipoprotein diacylglyceryl transferase [Eubacteriales bacterium]